MTGSQTVLSDPQFSVAHVLRPFLNFESIYAGQAAEREICFFPPGPDRTPAALDPQVGSPGIDPKLMRYLPVPLGARILVYIPHCITWQDSIQSPILETNYAYTMHWRVRNLRDSVAAQKSDSSPKPYHSQSYQGRPDTTAAAGQQARTVILSATRTVLVEQPEAAANQQQLQKLRRERVQLATSYTDSSALPLLPDGTEGVHMQGVLDPGQFPAALQQIAKSSIYEPFEFICEGDELCIGANRADAWGDDPNAWTFEGLDAPDAPFSNIYGTNVAGVAQLAAPGLGIYVFMGA